METIFLSVNFIHEKFDVKLCVIDSKLNNFPTENFPTSHTINWTEIVNFYLLFLMRLETTIVILYSTYLSEIA